MMPTKHPTSLRFLIAGGLVVVAVVLGLLVHAIPAPPEAPDYAGAQEGLEAVDAAVDAALATSNLRLADGKAVVIRMTDRQPVRKEWRFEVPPSFVGLTLNQELQNRLTPLDARVIATEHTKDRVIVMHIRRRGVVVRTLVFREREES